MHYVLGCEGIRRTLPKICGWRPFVAVIRFICNDKVYFRPLLANVNEAPKVSSPC